MRAFETYRVALRILRTRRGLWGLFGLLTADGALSALAGFAYGALLGVLFLWLAFSVLELSGAIPAAEVVAANEWIAGRLASWGAAVPVLVALVVLTFAAWVAVSVVSVAAQGGLVQQVDALYAGEEASTRAGLRSGFSAWWRLAGLIALPLLPGLVLGLAMAVSLMVTVSLPIMQGDAPNPGAAMASIQAWSSLSAPVSVAQTVLALVAITAMRPVMLEHLPIGAGIRRAWTVLKADWPGFLGVFAVSMLFGLTVWAVGWIVVGVLGGLGFVATAATWDALPSLSAVFAAIVVCVVLGVFGLMVALVHSVQSIAYTVWWREARAFHDARSSGGEIA